MNKSLIASVLCLVGGWLLIGGNMPGPRPSPVDDVLGQCHVADRASKVRILREMAATEFSSDAEQADWWNAEIDAARADDFQPFIDAVSEAIVGGTVDDLAESLEAAQ